LSAGTAIGAAVLNGGMEIVSGIFFNDYLHTVYNGVTSNSTVSSGSVMVVSAGGIAVSATVLICATQDH
jgi:autotransporter passenger strand-loop-strand repeat protein